MRGNGCRLGCHFASALLALLACSRQQSASEQLSSTKASPPTPSPRSTDQDRHELPSYVVLPLGAGESIVVDGRLDEPAWQKTAPTREFVHPGTGAPLGPGAPLGGTVRVRYDDTALYLAFEARDRNVRGGFDASSVDPHLWTRDTVELMLDPDGDGDNRDYYEIQVNPQGLVFDSRFDDYNSPRVLPDGPFGHQDFDSHLQRAVTVLGTLDDPSDQDRGYIVEAALPWKSLTKAQQVPPKAGSEWRANFYVMKDNGGVSWSPILGQGNFHKASRFGRLRFGGEDNRQRITPTSDPSSPSGIYIPTDLDDSFRELDRMLTKELHKEFQAGGEADLAKYHFGLGQWMRNNWGFWRESRLAQSLRALGVQHPDDMSGIIITSYWRHLNGKSIDLKKQIAQSRLYWASATEPPDKRCPYDKTKMSVDMQLDDRTPEGLLTLRHVAHCPKGHTWISSLGKGWEKPTSSDLQRIKGKT
jgi:hypothetical protein